MLRSYSTFAALLAVMAALSKGANVRGPLRSAQLVPVSAAAVPVTSEKTEEDDSDCSREGEFEDLLDSLSWRFTDPERRPTAAVVANFMAQSRGSSDRLDPAALRLHQRHGALAQAAAFRLQSWLAAVERTDRRASLSADSEGEELPWVKGVQDAIGEAKAAKKHDDGEGEARSKAQQKQADAYMRNYNHEAGKASHRNATHRNATEVNASSTNVSEKSTMEQKPIHEMMHNAKPSWKIEFTKTAPVADMKDSNASNHSIKMANVSHGNVTHGNATLGNASRAEVPPANPHGNDSSGLSISVQGEDEEVKSTVEDGTTEVKRALRTEKAEGKSMRSIADEMKEFVTRGEADKDGNATAANATRRGNRSKDNRTEDKDEWYPPIRGAMKVTVNLAPPGCAWHVPLDDPYWQQQDSYVICNGNECTTYNECRYSEGCTRRFTNLERVQSIRRTMAVTDAFLTKHDVTHTLYGGSAIGAYRCADVLPWDVDSDMLVMDYDYEKLMHLMDGGANHTGWREKGRSVDMGPMGFPGFQLMDKYPGCMPLVVVDRSTGFFTDLFPAHAFDDDVLSPWWSGEMICNTPFVFNDCHHWRCHKWPKNTVLPPTTCTLHTAQVSCQHNLKAWLYDHFGPGVEKANIKVRGGSAMLETHHKFMDDHDDDTIVTKDRTEKKSGKGEGASDEKKHSPAIFLCITLAMILVPVLFWACGASRVVQVFALYVALYMAWAMLTYAARDSVQSSAMVVLNALLIKLFISAVLWKVMDGDFSEIPFAAWRERSTLNQYIVPAGLYAAGDVLRVDALRATDPSTFAILFNSRVLFLIPVWQYAMGRKLEPIHWISLGAIVLGCIAKEWPHVHNNPNDARWFAYGEIVVLGVLTASAAVWNEMLLQKRAHVSVNLQNFAMYTWGMFWVLLIAVTWWWLVPGATNPFQAESWIIIWSSPLILASVVVLAVYGVTTAYFLRYLTNIAREVALGIFALLSVAMDRFLFGEQLVALEYAGAALVLTGIALFAHKPVVAAPISTLRPEEKATSGSSA